MMASKMCGRRQSVKAFGQSLQVKLSGIRLTTVWRTAPCPSTSTHPVRQVKARASNGPGARGTFATANPQDVEYPSISVPPASLAQPAAPLSAPSRNPWLLAATAGALALLGEAAYNWLSAQPSLPSLEEAARALGAGAVLLLGGVPSGLLACKAVMGDTFHVEFHRGRLYLSAGVPSSGPPLPPGAVVVRPTGDGRGNGAFAAARIPAGTHVADYSGELLDRAAFAARYPDNVGDFAMAVDDEYVIDAAQLAPHTAVFHAVHMNHSRVRPNVRRFYRRAERRVSFFTTVDIEPGQELLYDYGRAYWHGREHLELP